MTSISPRPRWPDSPACGLSPHTMMRGAGIAKRVRKTGNTTLRWIGDIARRQSIKDNDADFVSAADMLKELREDNLALVASLREAKDIVDEAKDNATSGILDEWTDQAEERAWFLFETSRKG